MGAKIFEILTYLLYIPFGMDYGIYCKICIREKNNKYGLFEGTSLSDLWNRSYYYVTISRKVSEQAYFTIFIAIIVLTTWEYLVGVLLEKYFIQNIGIILSKNLIFKEEFA